MTIRQATQSFPPCDICCGCGVCAGVCPAHNLAMRWNQYGEYNPVKLQECITECGLCRKVCPFGEGNPNEDELGQRIFGNTPHIQHRVETGYYLSAGAGAVSDQNHRMTSASGGLATWFLEELMRRKIVDEVISVEHADDGTRLFRFYAATVPEDVQKGKGSVYYPVEISGMLRKMMTEDKRYAIIGLPCVIKGLRLAQEKIPKLRERIVVMAGLTCNHLPSAKFTEYAAYRANLHEEVTFVSYRCKYPTKPRVFFEFQFLGIHGTKAEQKWNGDLQLERMFANRFCSLTACECCDDMHAELADVTFMDAWLPEYAQELRGTSLWIARSPLAEQILADGKLSKDLDVVPIEIERVISAQGAIRWKREMLSYRLTLMQEYGRHPPRKRVTPDNGSHLNCFERDECRMCLAIQQESREKIMNEYEGVGEWFDRMYADRPLPIRMYRRVRQLSWMGVHAPKYLWRKVSGIRRH